MITCFGLSSSSASSSCSSLTPASAARFRSADNLSGVSSARRAFNCAAKAAEPASLSGARSTSSRIAIIASFGSSRSSASSIASSSTPAAAARFFSTDSFMPASSARDWPAGCRKRDAAAAVCASTRIEISACRGFSSS